MLPRLHLSHPATPLPGDAVDSGSARHVADGCNTAMAYLKTADTPSPREFADRAMAACPGRGIPVGDVELPREVALPPESGDAP